MKTAALITHSHPPAATEAVATVVAAAADAGWRLVATADETSKHGAAATGVEVIDGDEARPDLCLVLGGDGSILHALRRFARTGALVGLDIVPGDTIHPMVDDTGRRPRGPGAVAYQQVIKGVAWADLTDAELIYAPAIRGPTITTASRRSNRSWSP